MVNEFEVLVRLFRNTILFEVGFSYRFVCVFIFLEQVTKIFGLAKLPH